MPLPMRLKRRRSGVPGSPQLRDGLRGRGIGPSPTPVTLTKSEAFGQPTAAQPLSVPPTTGELTHPPACR